MRTIRTCSRYGSLLLSVSSSDALGVQGPTYLVGVVSAAERRLAWSRVSLRRIVRLHQVRKNGEASSQILMQSLLRILNLHVVSSVHLTTSTNSNRAGESIINGTQNVRRCDFIIIIMKRRLP